MNFDNTVLNNEEKIIYALRSLFEKSGYSRYRMSKFEEYDLYVNNKDFLVSDKVITFTDTNGKLMALKPDVTLSIVKNTSDEPGSVRKVYYTENVYRAADNANGFHEIMQTGVECIGDLNQKDIDQIVSMAAESLLAISPDCVLEIAQLDIISALVDGLDISVSARSGILRCINEKNVHVLSQICQDEGINPIITESLTQLLGLYAAPKDALEVLDIIAENVSCELKNEYAGKLQKACEELRTLIGSVKEPDYLDIMRLDFSVDTDLKYYNGIMLTGFIPGIPEAVLSGGQYDQLMRKMKRNGKAIGFAIYIDLLQRLEITEGNAAAEDDGYLNIALPKGRLGEKVYEMFAQAGFECPSILENNRKLIFENPEAKVRYFWAKPSDVTTYVERGAADIGVAGKDIILEYEPDVYELLDLNVGKCRMCVAAPKAFTDDDQRTLNVATKFTNIAQTYYSSLGRDINIIHLNGSIEIAPILKLSDVIVDIVETGTTLKENDLEVKETIVPISARLIANKSSYKFHSDKIRMLQERLAKNIQI